MKNWISDFYKEHKWLSIMGISALVLGTLLLCIGFWRTLLLAAIVAVGVLIGTLLDRGGWPAVKDFFGGIIGKR